MRMRQCEAADCTSPATYKHYCQKHYRRNRQNGDPNIRGRKGPLPKDRKCSLEGCDNKHLAKGYCRKHYKRLQANGDPSALSPYMTEPRGNVSYITIHDSLAVWKGKAKEHMCPCGARAEEWSYDHQDSEELWHERPDQRGTMRQVPWSKKFEHYQPLCKSCHLERDRNWRVQR